MAAESSTETVTYHILVRGPNGEEERCVITPEDNSSTLRQRISLSPKFTTYTSFHFEVENTKGGDDLILDGYTPFSEVPGDWRRFNPSCWFLIFTMPKAFVIRSSIRLLSYQTEYP